jgi:hypothetical protein
MVGRLEGVRATGPQRWVARCPAHRDRRPSLSIAEGNDGRILLRCWAGCAVDAVVAAVGVELADLFPERSAGGRPTPRPWTAAQLLHLVDREACRILIAVADALRAGRVDAELLERATRARETIAAVVRELPR